MSTVSLSFYVRGGDGRKKREGRRKREKVGGGKKHRRWVKSERQDA